MERDNLRFQVRLLEQDRQEASPDRLRQTVGNLQLENRNAVAVESEHLLLMAKLEEVQRQLQDGAAEGPHTLLSRSSLAAAPEDDEELDQIRFENRLLQKKLQQARAYSEQLEQDLMRSQLKSSQMRCQTAISREAAALQAAATAASASLPSSSGVPSSTVDVLVLGDGGEEVDQWHEGG